MKTSATPPLARRLPGRALLALVLALSAACRDGGTGSTENPVPTLASLSPAEAEQGLPELVLTITGTGFVGGSVVRFNGTDRTTQYVGGTELRAVLRAADLATAGQAQVTVVNPEPGGGYSNPLPFVVRLRLNPVPAITSLATPEATAGQPGFVLRVNGTGFIAGSEVRFNGAARATQLAGPGQLEAMLLEGDLRNAGTYEITVANPAPGGGTSNPAQFRVLSSAPVLSTLPSQGASAGRSGFTLLVHGSGFTSASVVRWNGADRPTQFVSGTRLAANISSDDVASPGTAQVSVFNPGQGGGTSASVPFQVRAVPPAPLTGIRTVGLPARDLVYDAGTRRLYATIPGNSEQYPNSVVAIDPETGAVTGSAFVGSEPGALALSPDGQVLWVGLDGSADVRRVVVATLTPGLQFSLNGALVEELEVAPGSPGTVAVSLKNPSTSPRHLGVAVYDDGVRRTQAGPGHTGSNSIEFGEDATVLYGYNNETTEFGFRRMQVGAGGVLVGDVVGGLIGSFYTRIHYAAGRVYATTGEVIDGGRAVRVGVMGGGTSFSRVTVAVSPALGRAFYLDSGRIDVFDLNTFAPLGSVAVGSFHSEHPALRRVRLVFWGSDGLAFNDGQKIHILRTPIAGG